MKKLALLLFFTATLSASDNMLPKKTKHSYVDLASPKDPSTWEGIRQELKAKIPALKSPARWADIEPHQGQSETNQEDFNSIYDQFDICGNCLRKSISCVDETYTIKPRLMKKPTTLNKKEKKSKEGRRKQDCIISLFFSYILSKFLH